MKELSRNRISTREAMMDCTPSSKGNESLVQVAVAYTTAMVERLCVGISENRVVLEEMEKAVLEE